MSRDRQPFGTPKRTLDDSCGQWNSILGAPIYYGKRYQRQIFQPLRNRVNAIDMNRWGTLTANHKADDRLLAIARIGKKLIPVQG